MKHSRQLELRGYRKQISDNIDKITAMANSLRDEGTEAFLSKQEQQALDDEIIHLEEAAYELNRSLRTLDPVISGNLKKEVQR